MQWWISQVVDVGDESGSRLQLRIVDPRLGDLDGADPVWIPSPSFADFEPIYLGNINLVEPPEEEWPEAPDGIGNWAPLWAAPSLGCDATSFYDTTQFLCACACQLPARYLHACY
eukprot:SAG25_NODE_655_length_6126_cov_12.125270_8_plen_115_part_00